MGLRLIKRAMVIFPCCHMVFIIWALIVFINKPAIIRFIIVIIIIYFLPIALFRVQNIFLPIKEGKYQNNTKTFIAWWGAMQLQQVYAIIPAFEAILRIIPGAYSFWLRLWGAKIGKQIYWTPMVEVVDRMLLEVGDYTIFGHHAGCCSHAIFTQNDQLILYIGKIRIGKNVLIGGACRLGPGTKICDNINLPVFTDLLPNRNIEYNNQLKQTNVHSSHSINSENIATI